MAKPLPEQVAAIEAEVRRRRVKSARDLIQKFLRAQRKTPEAKVMACRWYARLGLYLPGYHLIAPKDFRNATLDERLWSAQFLNLLGANAYAVQLVRGLKPTGIERLSIVGEIYLSQYRYADALPFFEEIARATKPDPSVTPYRMKLLRVALADCQAGLGRREEAIRTLDAIEVGPEEKLLQGIVLQARAECLARLKRWAPARDTLEKALAHFPEGDRTPDRGYLAKWMGFVHAGLGDTRKARARFAEARGILIRPDFRDEMGLDCLKLEHEAGLLGDAEWHFLRAFPGLPPGFWGGAAPAPVESWPKGLAAEQAKIRIYPDRGEFHRGTRRSPVLSKEILLLSLVLRAGDWGLSIEKAKTMLWPEEFGAFPQLESRVHQLLRQLKLKHKIHAYLADRRIRLKGAVPQIWVESDGAGRPLTFFESRPEFTAREFGDHYGVGTSYSNAFLVERVRSGELRSRREGRRTVYALAR